MSIQWRICQKWLISNFFLYERRYLKEDKLLEISNSDTKLSVTFCVHRYARRQLQNRIWIATTRTANYRLYFWRKVHKNLVTYEFRNMLFWYYLKDKRKGKNFTNGTKSNSNTLLCSYMISKIYSWYFNFL